MDYPAETGITPASLPAGIAVSKATSPHAGLVVRGIAKSFVGIKVLDGIDLDVRPGEVMALLGENGAGKSTLSAIVAGAHLPDAGRILWRGEPYAPASPREAIARGIGMIHQEMRLLPDLSIAENVFVGRLPRRGGIVDRAAMNSRATAELRRLGLDLPPTQLVRSLKVAAQQQVEIAKALVLDAQLLILDEPTAALGGPETELLFAQIRKLKAEGISFIYISHRLDEIAAIADRITVMRDGRVVGTHDRADVPVKTIVEQMVGRSVERMFPKLSPPQDRVVLDVKDLTSKTRAFRDVSFAVRAGEVLGIAGLIGAGRTELVRAITGADPVSAGTVSVDAKPVHLRGPRDALRAGLVLVPEDRKAHGMALEHSIAENLVIGNLDAIAPGAWVWPEVVRRFARAGIKRLGVKGHPDQPVRKLSGGNQQKVVIAKWLARDPKVFILDEPTRGIDVGARAAIYEIIAGLARTGMAVIVVSSDLEEVLGLSHRILVLSRGRQTGILPRATADNVSVMELATS